MNFKYIYLSFVCVVITIMIAVGVAITINDDIKEKAAFYSIIVGVITILITLLIAVTNNSIGYYSSTFQLLLEQLNKEEERLRSSKLFKIMVSEILIRDSKNIEFNNAGECSYILHKYDYLIGSYFRVLFRILKHIDMNSPYYGSGKIEKFHSGIVRSFIQQDILLLLSINCYFNSKGSVSSEEKVPNNKYNTSIEENKIIYRYYINYIEKYCMLEHLILNSNGLFNVLRDRFDMESGDEKSKATLKNLLNEITCYYSGRKYNAFGKNPGNDKLHTKYNNCARNCS